MIAYAIELRIGGTYLRLPISPGGSALRIMIETSEGPVTLQGPLDLVLRLAAEVLAEAKPNPPEAR